MSLHAYSAFHNHEIELTDSARVALLSIPLSRFRWVPGCVTGLTHSFKPEDKGKKFRVKILDPVDMGMCVFRGFGFEDVPQSKFRDEMLRQQTTISTDFLVFEKTTKKHKCIFVVHRDRCDAFPIKE